MMYRYEDAVLDYMDTNRYLSNQHYLQRGSSMYSTLPSKKTQFFTNEIETERSTTPDITRGLEKNFKEKSIKEATYKHNIFNKNKKVNFQHSLPRNFYKTDQNLLNQKLGKPIQVPDINVLSIQNASSSCTSVTPTKIRNRNYLPHHYQHIKTFDDTNETMKISPIDPRNSTSFQSSTPSSKNPELKAAVNLENKLMSPKKSTMSNEELYAVIHKSKKKMNIGTSETPRSSPVTVENEPALKQTMKFPETGYLGDKSKSRLSWSPSKGDYMDFSSEIDKLSPPNEIRSRQSWAYIDRKTPKPKQTSTIDFKRLLLQKCSISPPKKLSAVEQLKLSKQQLKPSPPKTQQDMNILDLSGSPRSLINRRFLNNSSNSPSRELKPAAKILSPRTQWKFANPRSDVLSSTILEDCREEESPNNSRETKSSPKVENKITNKKENFSEILLNTTSENKPYMTSIQRLHAQRAQFFNPVTQQSSQNSQLRNREHKDNSNPPTLETAF